MGSLVTRYFFQKMALILLVPKLKKCRNQNSTQLIQPNWWKDMAPTHSACMKCSSVRLNKANPGIRRVLKVCIVFSENYGDCFLTKQKEKYGPVKKPRTPNGRFFTKPLKNSTRIQTVFLSIQR